MGIFVTGVSLHIRSAIVPALLQAGHCVTGHCVTALARPGHGFSRYRDRRRSVPAYLRDKRFRRRSRDQCLPALAPALCPPAGREHLERYRFAHLEHRPQRPGGPLGSRVSEWSHNVALGTLSSHFGCSSGASKSMTERTCDGARRAGTGSLGCALVNPPADGRDWCPVRGRPCPGTSMRFRAFRASRMGSNTRAGCYPRAVSQQDWGNGR